MELDDLKYGWHTLGGTTTSEPLPATTENWRPQGVGLNGSKEALTTLLHKRSRGPIAKMRRNLVAELLLVFATYTPVIGYYLLGPGGRFSAIGWALALLLATFTAYCLRKDRLLSHMSSSQLPMRTHLERQVANLEQYIRVYTIWGTVLAPLMAIAAFVLLRREFPGGGNSPWWILLAPITIGIYAVNTRYANRAYGRHIQHLKELLKEMQEE